MKALTPSFLLVCLCSLQAAGSQPAPATWRAVSIDIKERLRSSEEQTAGSITQVSYNSDNRRFTIPFAKPTDRFPIGAGGLHLFQHPQPLPEAEVADAAPPPSAAGADAPATTAPAPEASVLPESQQTLPELLAQMQLPANRGDMLLLLWPSTEANTPYRLLPLPDQRPQAGKRLLRLINCTPQPLYALIEGKPHEILPLQPIAIECDAQGRSRVELYRPPQANTPARRISSSSYRVAQGELLTALLLPTPDDPTPQMYIFRDY